MHFIRLIENHNPASFTLHIRVRVVLLMTDIMSCTTFVRTTKHISRHGQTFRFFPKESRQAKFLEGCFCRAESARHLNGCLDMVMMCWRQCSENQKPEFRSWNATEFGLVRALAAAHGAWLASTNRRPSLCLAEGTALQKFRLPPLFS